MQIITLKELLDANRKAIADRTLIAFNGRSIDQPIVDYWNPKTGCGCAIGVAMTPDTRNRVLRIQERAVVKTYTYMSIDTVCDYGLVTFHGHHQARAIAAITQKLHDQWYGKGFMEGVLLVDGEGLTRKAFGDVGWSTVVTQEHFTTWLDHVEKTYLPEPVA